jgi:hypothetical protein
VLPTSFLRIPKTHSHTSLQVLHFCSFCKPTFSGATREWDALYKLPFYCTSIPLSGITQWQGAVSNKTDSQHFKRKAIFEEFIKNYLYKVESVLKIQIQLKISKVTSIEEINEVVWELFTNAR